MTKTKTPTPKEKPMTRQEQIAMNLAMQLESRAVERAEQHKEFFLDRFMSEIRKMFPGATDQECLDVIREVLDQEAGEALICLEFTGMNSYLAFMAKEQQPQRTLAPCPFESPKKEGVR